MVKNVNPLISIIAGILVIVFPDLLAWIIGLYLIITGAMKLAK